MMLKELLTRLKTEGTIELDFGINWGRVLPYTLHGNTRPTVFNIIIDGTADCWVHTVHDLADYLYNHGIIQKPLRMG